MLILRKKKRIPIGSEAVGVQLKIMKMICALALIFVVPCIVYFLFVVFIGSSVLRDFARYSFLISLGLWSLLEIYLCFSVSEKLNQGGLFRKTLFALPVVLSIALTCYLFPVLLTTYPFPPKEECVVLELPFNGIWLAGHAGGNFVILNIGNGKYVYFGHFKRATISVKAGDRISAGTFIGSVGNSGNTTLPHLHMHVQNKPISDPENRITIPFRFREIQRMRIAFWKRVENGYLLRNDRVLKTVVE